MTDATTALREHARRLGREVHEAGGLGLGVEFADGHDAFWLLSDPAVTTADPARPAGDAVRLYDQLDRARSAALAVLWAWLRHRGLPVTRGDEGWQYRPRDITSPQGIDVDVELTRVLLELGPGAEPSAVMDKWLGWALYLGPPPADFVAAHRRDLPPPREPDGRPVRIELTPRMLSTPATVPADLPAEPPPLTAEAVAATDAAAGRRLARFWRQPAFHFYRDGLHHVEGDDWATLPRWLAALEEHPRGATSQREDAVPILADAGDPRAEEVAARVVSGYFPFVDKPSLRETWVAWHYRHLDVERMREACITKHDEFDSLLDVRAEAGDPVARRIQRRVAGRTLHSLGSLELLRPADLTAGRQRELRAALVEAVGRLPVARGWETLPLLMPAVRGRWAEVAGALRGNGELMRHLLTPVWPNDIRGGGPIVLGSGPVLLAWSLIDPSPFLAGVLAAVFRLDPLRLLAEVCRRGAADADAYWNDPYEVRGGIDRLWLDAAVAWWRCRAAGVADRAAHRPLCCPQRCRLLP